uniref:Uncharacterized protein n=1 Tax=Kalanchoe fedtschenkoi TaxID=63787 RepID=A0A7N0UXE4_KALFE
MDGDGAYQNFGAKMLFGSICQLREGYGLVWLATGYLSFDNNAVWICLPWTSFLLTKAMLWIQDLDDGQNVLDSQLEFIDAGLRRNCLAGVYQILI